MKSVDPSSNTNVADRSSPKRRARVGRSHDDVRAAALEARISELQSAADDADIEESSGGPEVQQPATKSSDLSRIEARDTVGDDDQITTHVAGNSTDILPQTAPQTKSRRLGPGRCQRFLKRNVRTGPSWLISASVHTLLLVILTLLSPEIESMRAPIAIASGKAVAKEAPLMITPRESETAPEEFTFSSLNFGASDARPANASSVSLDHSRFKLAKFSASEILGDRVDASLGLPVFRSANSQNHQGGAQFFGVQAQGNSFVFIVDSSASMALKFADTIRELEAAIRRLDEHQKFYVIFFDGKTERMRLGEWNEGRTRYRLNRRTEPALVPATEDNIAGCAEWMKTIQLGGRTNPYDAVVFAVKDLRPDAIYLLSDGEFNEGGITEAYLSEQNVLREPVDGKGVKSIVHCIGFYSRRGEITLQRVADTNGGTYRFVPPPDGWIPVGGPTHIRLLPVRK